MDYLETNNKTDCFGCEACVQICPKSAISMHEDIEGFRYPYINKSLCIECNQCHIVCPSNSDTTSFARYKSLFAFGGYHKDINVRKMSTSGGIFTAIVQAWAKEHVDYIIFGATSEKLEVFHKGISNIDNLKELCRSKYSQSKINDTYYQTKDALIHGKSVLFSGTPCQIAGLKSFLRKTDTSKLLLVEVVCEGVPSPLYIRKLNEHILKKYGSNIKNIDYRYKGDKNTPNSFKWDFERMCIELSNGKKLKKDRWFNPFWSIWLQHLMSRPSCYKCPYTTTKRTADITLGDLWGVHKYCPDLYGNNGGTSLVLCNTEKGERIFKVAKRNLFGHELLYDEALKYQGPLRQNIKYNPNRKNFMNDIQGEMTYQAINKKWAKPLSIKLLFSKYIWGNRQKVFMWNINHRKTGNK